MRKRLVLLIAFFLLPWSRVSADDYVLKIIDCPSDIFAKFDWVKKIGSDPTFSEDNSMGYSPPRARIVGMSRNEQRFSCTYETSALSVAPGRKLTYSYTVHRKILECRRRNERSFECRLER